MAQQMVVREIQEFADEKISENKLFFLILKSCKSLCHPLLSYLETFSRKLGHPVLKTLKRGDALQEDLPILGLSILWIQCLKNPILVLVLMIYSQSWVDFP